MPEIEAIKLGLKRAKQVLEEAQRYLKDVEFHLDVLEGKQSELPLKVG